MPSGPFPPHPPPQYPHHHQQPRQPPWVPPSDHLQQFHQPSSFPPGVAPPLGMQFLARPMYPPPHPTHSHAPHAQPPPLPPQPSALPQAYSQPSQMWGNPSWHAAQGWNYSDWGARARAWAAANSTTEDLPVQSQFTSFGTPNNIYNDQYQHSVMPPFSDSQHSTVSAPEQHFPDSGTDLHRRLNNLQGPPPNSMPTSVANFPTYDDGYDTIATERSVTVSPQPSFTSSTSVNVQEVPSSYPSFSGGKETMDTTEKLHMPSHLSSPAMPIPGRLPVLSVSPLSRDQSIESSGMSDQSQAIEQIPFDRGQIHGTFSTNTNQVRPIDQSAPSSSIHGFAQTTAPVPVFSNVTPVPPGPQFDSSSITSSLPGHPSQAFGRIQGLNFQPGISPVGPTFSFDVGPPHPATAFPVDTIESFNLSERPKKAAVPNWLRDEIIKKKASIVSSAQEHPNGSSHSAAAEVHDKDFRQEEPVDSKSIDSARSTEDEEDDEDDADAVRSAAINQEIKRVLTDVLLKVTDELFEEIATKVLNEDEPDADHIAVVAKHRDSTSPPASITPKSSSKVMVPSATAVGKSVGADQPKLGSSGGVILGLADYASDDESEEVQGSSFLSSRKVSDTYERHETAELSSEDEGKQEKEGTPIAAVEPIDVTSGLDSSKRTTADSNGDVTKHMKDDTLVHEYQKDLKTTDPGRDAKFLESSSNREKKDLVGGKIYVASDLALSRSNHGKSKATQFLEPRRKSPGLGDDPEDRKAPSHRNFVNEGGFICWDSKKKLNRDQIQERINERSLLKRGSKDQSSRQAVNLDSGSRKPVYHDDDVNGKRVLAKDRRDRMKDDGDWKREITKDEKEDRFRQAMKDSHKQKKRQTSSPSARVRSGRDSSLDSASVSGEEIIESSKKRKLQSSRQSLSPSPTRSRRYIQVLRSPHSKHSQRRHSPYSHSDSRRSRSRSSSPGHRRRSGHRRQ
ncbi:unnamed protein product [Spirodela intermedia]|uniref:Uncharacterized protein n=1 Tax=Spirodela intermedia TaxID=51605 RepID=A0A7I8JD86_SPIIN|nr:unnamed protein product [Spirodela intermedia]CAA6667971.1 unnamed protein product [Spirodela intermedia]